MSWGIEFIDVGFQIPILVMPLWLCILLAVVTGVIIIRFIIIGSPVDV